MILKAYIFSFTVGGQEDHQDWNWHVGIHALCQDVWASGGDKNFNPISGAPSTVALHVLSYLTPMLA